MEDKKLVRILIILVVILIFAIILFASLLKSNNTKSSNKPNDKTGYVDSKYESTLPSVSYDDTNKYKPKVINKQYSLLTSEERKEMDKNFDFLIDAINQRKYEELYNQMTDEYKKIRFDTLDSFKKYIDSTFSKKCYCTSYEITNYGCIVNVAFEGEQNQTQKIMLKNYYAQNSKNILIYFEEIIEIENTPNRFKVADILIEIEHMIKYPETTTFCLNIKNMTKQNAKINFTNSKLIRIVAGTANEYDVVRETLTEIPANKEQKAEVEFNYSGKSFYVPDIINFVMEINDKVYEKEAIVEILEVEP